MQCTPVSSLGGKYKWWCHTPHNQKLTKQSERDWNFSSALFSAPAKTEFFKSPKKNVRGKHSPPNTCTSASPGCLFSIQWQKKEQALISGLNLVRWFGLFSCPFRVRINKSTIVKENLRMTSTLDWSKDDKSTCNCQLMSLWYNKLEIWHGGICKRKGYLRNF